MSSRPDTPVLADSRTESFWTRDAESAGFDVVLTVDHGFGHQQNLAGRTIAAIIFRTKSIALGYTRIPWKRIFKPGFGFSYAEREDYWRAPWPHHQR